MEVIRVIAVEKVTVTSSDSVEPAIACVYKNQKLFVYDTFGELYHQKEYFGDFGALEYLINKGKYEWTDFTIEKGQLITKDVHDNIVVEGEIVHGITPLNNNPKEVNATSIKLYYNFLQRVNKDNPQILTDLKSSFEDGTFKNEIELILSKHPLKELSDYDKLIIVRSRLDGFSYIKTALMEMSSSFDPLKIDKITFFFTRLFKLEYSNYIKLTI